MEEKTRTKTLLALHGCAAFWCSVLTYDLDNSPKMFGDAHSQLAANLSVWKVFASCTSTRTSSSSPRRSLSSLVEVLLPSGSPADGTLPLLCT